jgi:predicted GNAT family N-acyltransferase
MKYGARTNGHASLSLRVATSLPQSMRKNVIELHALRTNPNARQAGHATDLMIETCLEADLAQRFLMLAVEPSDDCPIDQTTLSNFYMRFGFAPIQTSPVVLMVRPYAGAFYRAN